MGLAQLRIEGACVEATEIRYDEYACHGDDGEHQKNFE
jgi:hypothetical protein